MGSSKKKGQQRKAAAKRAQQSAEIVVASSINSGVGVSGASGGAVSGNSSHSKIVAKVRRGNNYATKRLVQSGVRALEDFSYEHSGVLSVVLEFLNRCEDETFEGIMNSIGGDLKSPSLWITIIRNASYDERSCKLQIAENIGPLVRCMVNDTDRLFFKGNKHWVESIRPFVSLVKNVMVNKASDSLECEQIVNTTLQYEGLLSSIVQWGFWSEKHRPDIMKELKYEGLTDDCDSIFLISRNILKPLVSDETGSQVEESRIRLLKTIGTTPIINHSYDPSCTVSYTAGLVCRLRHNMQERDLSARTLQRLIREADCVDKGVITEMIDLGTNYTPDYEGAYYVTLLSSRCINPQDAHMPSDTRTAFAIREGLIEMCLNFIGQYGKACPSSFYIQSIFYKIHGISLHQKSAKAIRHKRVNIEEKLHQLEENTDITSSAECKMLLDMVSSILNINGSYCCRCNKSLSKTEVKQCNGCHRMTYCSKACQKEDWLNGHSVTCCKSYTDENVGQFQGRVVPETIPQSNRAAKLDELEKNMTMIQLKLFIDNSETILGKAKSLDIPLYDCIVVFDLRKCPPVVTTESYIEWFDTPVVTKCFEETRSKENITCMYTSFFYNNGDLCPSGRAPNVTMQRMFPHTWLKNSFDHRSQPIAESTSSSCAQTEQYCELHISHRMNDEEVSILTESVFEEEVPDGSPK